MANSHRLKLAWGHLAYTDMDGDGLPYLFLHGTGCDSEDWMVNSQW